MHSHVKLTPSQRQRASRTVGRMREMLEHCPLLPRAGSLKERSKAFSKHLKKFNSGEPHLDIRQWQTAIGNLGIPMSGKDFSEDIFFVFAHEDTCMQKGVGTVEIDEVCAALFVEKPSHYTDPHNARVPEQAALRKLTEKFANLSREAAEKPMVAAQYHDWRSHRHGTNRELPPASGNMREECIYKEKSGVGSGKRVEHRDERVDAVHKLQSRNCATLAREAERRGDRLATDGGYPDSRRRSERKRSPSSPNKSRGHGRTQ